MKKMLIFVSFATLSKMLQIYLFGHICYYEQTATKTQVWSAFAQHVKSRKYDILIKFTTLSKKLAKYQFQYNICHPHKYLGK